MVQHQRSYRPLHMCPDTEMGTVIPEFGSLNPAYACAEDYRIVVAGSHSAIGGKTRLMHLDSYLECPRHGNGRLYRASGRARALQDFSRSIIDIVVSTVSTTKEPGMSLRAAVLTTIVAISAVIPVQSGSAQNYPTKPIHLIVPYPAGGATA